MRATRLRLRFVPGVSVTAATYGSSTFGGLITYGQRATDTLAAYRYRVVPLPGGFPTRPAWIFRHGDLTPPLRMQLLSDDAPFDLTPVIGTLYGDYTYDYRTYGGGNATLVLTPEAAWPSVVLHLEIDGPANQGVLTHIWDPTVDPDLPPGVYRALVYLNFYSGRRLTLPTDDDLQLVVT
jgi:hypothetical protein